MEAHLEADATPARIRRAMRRHGLSAYGIAKAESAWYVYGGDSASWDSCSLNTFRFDGKSVAFWIRAILDMRDAHKAAHNKI